MATSVKLVAVFQMMSPKVGHSRVPLASVTPTMPTIPIVVPIKVPVTRKMAIKTP